MNTLFNRQRITLDTIVNPRLANRKWFVVSKDPREYQEIAKSRMEVEVMVSRLVISRNGDVPEERRIEDVNLADTTLEREVHRRAECKW